MSRNNGDDWIENKNQYKSFNNEKHRKKIRKNIEPKRLPEN